jgi:hypothetical protein
MPHIWPFLSMIARELNRLSATRQGWWMRRQDARHRAISDTNFWPDNFEGDSP